MSFSRTGPPTSVPQLATGTFFADAVKHNPWPEIDPTTLQAWATNHRKLAQQLTDAANLSKPYQTHGPNSTYGHLFHELCQGQAGTALQNSLANIANLWQEHAANHQSAAAALDDAAEDVEKLRDYMTNLINLFEPAYKTAYSRNQTPVAQAILAKTESFAQKLADFFRDRILSAALNGAFGKAPPAPKLTPPVPAPGPPPPLQAL